MALVRLEEMTCDKLIFGSKCQGKLMPQRFVDEHTGKNMIDGLKCSECDRMEITSTMTKEEYGEVLLDYHRYKTQKIVDVKFNEEVDKYDYKELDVTLEDKSIKIFHHHKNNPMPTKEEIIGLTWDELCKLCSKMFYDKLKEVHEASHE